MGRPIVYCEGCGLGLREEEFDRGRAVEVDRRPWCAGCRPPSAERPPVPTPSPRKRATDRVPIARPSPRASQTVQKVSTRRSPGARDRRAWIVVAVVVGLVLLGLIVAVASRPRTSRTPTDRPGRSTGWGGPALPMPLQSTADLWASPSSTASAAGAASGRTTS